MSCLIFRNHNKDFPLVLAFNDEVASTDNLNLNNPSIIDNFIGLSFNNRLTTGINKNSLFIKVVYSPASNFDYSSLIKDFLKYETLPSALEWLSKQPVNLKETLNHNLIVGCKDTALLATPHIADKYFIEQIPAGVSCINYNTNNVCSAIQVNQIKKIHNYLSENNYILNGSEDMQWIKYYNIIKSCLRFLLSKEDFTTIYSSVLCFSTDGFSRFKYYDRFNKKSKLYTDLIDMYKTL